MSEPHQKMSLLPPFLILIFVAVTAVYGVNALNTQDWLWFQSKTTIVERPHRIVIIDHGRRTELLPGHDNYSELASATESALTELANSDLINIGLSQETLADYKDDSLVMELYFNRPLRFHTSSRTGEPTQILIPLEGRHAGSGYFFRGAQGTWWYGAMRMADPGPLYAALAQMGYVDLAS